MVLVLFQLNTFGTCFYLYIKALIQTESYRSVTAVSEILVQWLIATDNINMAPIPFYLTISDCL